jgi:hypothetical protein
MDEEGLPGDPESWPAQEASLLVEDESLPGEPANLLMDEEGLPGDPESLPAQEASLLVEDESLPGEPANLPMNEEDCRTIRKACRLRKQAFLSRRQACRASRQTFPLTKKSHRTDLGSSVDWLGQFQEGPNVTRRNSRRIMSQSHLTGEDNSKPNTDQRVRDIQGSVAIPPDWLGQFQECDVEAYYCSNRKVAIPPDWLGQFQGKTQSFVVRSEWPSEAPVGFPVHQRPRQTLSLPPKDLTEGEVLTVNADLPPHLLFIGREVFPERLTVEEAAFLRRLLEIRGILARAIPRRRFPRISKVEIFKKSQSHLTD